MRNGEVVDRTVRAVDPSSRAAINAVDISNQVLPAYHQRGFQRQWRAWPTLLRYVKVTGNQGCRSSGCAVARKWLRGRVYSTLSLGCLVVRWGFLFLWRALSFTGGVWGGWCGEVAGGIMPACQFIDYKVTYTWATSVAGGVEAG